MIVVINFPDGLEKPTSVEVSDTSVVLRWGLSAFAEITSDGLSSGWMPLTDKHFEFFESIRKQIREGGLE